MVSNSIRSNIDKESILSEIKLTLSNDFIHEKVVIVVEGNDDYRFFKGGITDNVEIVESFSGKHGVMEIISEVNDNRVIGIRDKDFDQPIENNRLFYYDYSCLEVMLVMNDATWKAVYDEFYDGKLSESELREKIFNDLKWLTLFRKLDCDNEWGVRFNGYSIENAYNKNSECFDSELGFSVLAKINSDKSEEELKQHNVDVKGEISFIKNDDLPDFTQGHDCINYYKCICDRGKGINIKTIEHSLRSAYRMDDFIKSKLYRKMVDFSELNYKNILSDSNINKSADV